MKKIINVILATVIIAGIVFISAILPGCSKEVARNQQTGSIEMYYNGVLKQYDQTNTGTVSTTGGKIFSFNGTKEPTTENFFNLTFKSDSLRCGVYTVGNTGTVLYREGGKSASNVNNTSFTVTIFSNADHLINGTFTGVLTDQDGHNSYILQGRLINVFMQ